MELLNKSKKIINTFENIDKINEIKDSSKIEKKTNKSKILSKTGLKKIRKTKLSKVKTKKPRTLWVRKKK